MLYIVSAKTCSVSQLGRVIATWVPNQIVDIRRIPKDIARHRPLNISCTETTK